VDSSQSRAWAHAAASARCACWCRTRCQPKRGRHDGGTGCSSWPLQASICDVPCWADTIVRVTRGSPRSPRSPGRAKRSRTRASGVVKRSCGLERTQTAAITNDVHPADEPWRVGALLLRPIRVREQESHCRGLSGDEAAALRIGASRQLSRLNLGRLRGACSPMRSPAIAGPVPRHAAHLGLRSDRRDLLPVFRSNYVEPVDVSRATALGPSRTRVLAHLMPT